MPNPDIGATGEDPALAAPATGLPGLDLDRLRTYLDATTPGLVTGPLTGQVIAGGRSNLTYALADGTHTWAVRRPPLGHVLATAHDMSREYRVLSALAPTGVPVPATIAHCDDPAVIGAPFYVMQYVGGAVYRSGEDIEALPAHRRQDIAHALVDVLAQLHDVDPAAVGLADFGRPEGFLVRQVRRWKIQLDASHSRQLTGADDLHAGLAARIPASTHACLLHGDYRLDNVIMDAGDQVAAVLDWEMSTLGDPLTDLALFLVYYAGLGAGLGTGLGTEGGTEGGTRGGSGGGSGLATDAGGRITVADSPAPGFPSGAALAARYALRHRIDLSRLDWYLALAFFKLAVISEGIHYRYATGQTVGAGFDQVGGTVEPLLTAGAEALARDIGANGDDLQNVRATTTEDIPENIPDTFPDTIPDTPAAGRRRVAGLTTEEEQPPCLKP